MKLLIVESPSKAKTINQYLGKDFIVISSYGHIRGLPSEEGSVRPDEDFAMTYTIMDRSEKRVSDIIKNVKKCDEVYLATDPDREGEAISWHIIESLKERKALPKGLPIKRVVFHEITKTAVQQAIKNSRDIDTNLVQAQQARQALDYLVGFTLSPVLWRKLPGSRSAGRVQSVALRIICDREEEIEKFVTQEYWSIEGVFQKSKKTFSATLTNFMGKKLDKFAIPNEKKAKDIVSRLEGLKYSVANIEKKQVSRSPQPPFTTSTLIQEAARKLGFSAKKTSRMAQDLYEGQEVDGKTLGLITYMRTDSVSISAEALAATRDHIENSFGGKYLPKNPKAYKTKTKNAQEAHEAIRPTNIGLTPREAKPYLDSDHFRLYELIWKRLVASQMENALFDQVSIDISSEDNKNTFRASGSTMVFDGFYKLYIEDKDDAENKDEQKLPVLDKDENLKLDKINPEQHFTQPPPRYSEASLVKKMEELGIGRPSTYPTIISILQDREYVRIDKKRFFPESKGRLVIAFLLKFFTRYVEYDFTAKLEDELDDISNGEIEWKQVLRDFWNPFKSKTDEVMEIKKSDVTSQIEENIKDYIFDGLEKNKEGERKCPDCKTGTLHLKTGKFGAFVGCSNYPTCKYIHKVGTSQGEDEPDGGAGSSNAFPIILGNDENDSEISIRKGPYGIYIQRTKGKDIKRVGLPKGVMIDQVTMEYANNMLSLPRVIGPHPEDGKNVNAGIGRFGPYVEHNKVYKSIKNDDPITITLESALHLLSQPSKPRFARKKKT